jgi:hypothetical protein
MAAPRCWWSPPSRKRNLDLKAISPGRGELGLADVQPGDRAVDQHPLDFRRALEDREDPGLRGSIRRSAACITPWYQHGFSTGCSSGVSVSVLPADDPEHGCQTQPGCSVDLATAKHRFPLTHNARSTPAPATCVFPIDLPPRASNSSSQSHQAGPPPAGKRPPPARQGGWNGPHPVPGLPSGPGLGNQ